ncbi:MAG: DUF6391 domain-containing protein [bacterium]|nr:DUF6391 domain-containing protein [bacterium]
MIERIAKAARPILYFPIIRRVRRNHALEHATIHMLSRANRNLRMAGRSSDGGFVLIGNVATDQVEKAADDALRRLNSGESNLALHPNCGTNLVTAGALTTFVALIGMGSRSRPVTPDRLSWTMTMMILALIVSQPLGMTLQKHITTEGDPGDLEIIGVTKREIPWPLGGTVTLHNVNTRRG